MKDMVSALKKRNWLHFYKIGSSITARFPLMEKAQIIYPPSRNQRLSAGHLHIRA